MSMPGKIEPAVGFCAVLAAALATMFYWRDVRPVLFRVNPDPGMVRPRFICVLNPFRDSASEAEAEALLAKLRSGHREDPHRLLDAESRAHILMREGQYPIRAWRMCWRSDGPTGTNLGYWVTREHYEGEDEIWLDLSYRGHWTVTAFNAIY